MRRVVIIGGLGLIFLLNTLVFADAAGPVGLKYQLETGSQYRYRMNVSTQTVQQVREQRVGRTEAWDIEYEMTTLSGSKNKSGTLLRVTYNSIEHSFSSPFQQYSYQLTAGDTQLPKVLQPYAELIGTDFNLKLQNRVKLLPKEAPPVQSLDLQQLFTVYSPEAQVAINSFPNLVQNLFPVYGRNPKSFDVGYGWPEQICIANGRISPEVTVNYRITNISGKDIELEFETPDGWDFDRKYTYKNNRKVVAQTIAKLTGTAKGCFKINRLTGLPVWGAIKLALTGELQKLGVSIPVSLQTDIDFCSMDWDQN